MDSIWNWPFHDHSMIIPYGIHDVHGTMNWLWSQLTFIPWIPHGIGDGFHGFHMDSIWINPGKVKTSPWRIKCVATFPLLHPRVSWATLDMHAFKFTRPFALIIAFACLAIAVPTSDVPNSAVIKDAIATHLPVATSTTDKTGGLTLKQDSSDCGRQGSYCESSFECCSGVCGIEFPLQVSAPPLICWKG